MTYCVGIKLNAGLVFLSVLIATFVTLPAARR